MEVDIIKILSLILSFLSLIGIGYIFQGWWADKREKRKKNTEEAKLRAKQERQAEIAEVLDEKHARWERRIDQIEKVWDERITKAEVELDKLNEMLVLNEVATQASLRNDILVSFYQCAKKGYRTQDDSENFRHMYDAYHGIQGNSFIDKDISGWFYELPLKNEQR